jgi:hypothetical protein
MNNKTKTAEKAEELFDKFFNLYPNQDALFIAKEAALIFVNERLQELNFTHIGYGKEIMEGYQKTKVKYWNDIKTELEKY